MHAMPNRVFLWHVCIVGVAPGAEHAYSHRVYLAVLRCGYVLIAAFQCLIVLLGPVQYIGGMYGCMLVLLALWCKL